jgi:hypothetical protein
MRDVIRPHAAAAAPGRSVRSWRRRLALLAAAPLGLLAILPGRAEAAIAECTTASLRAAAAPGTTIADITNLGPAGMPKTLQGAVDIPANALGDGAPEYCFVTGSVVTNPKTGKTANFAAALPTKADWNGKFLFEGCGGNCGTVFFSKPPAGALRRGYPVFATDDGHVAKIGPSERLWRQSETSWAITAPGKRDEDTTADFFYRAVHSVVAAGKALTRKYYGAVKLSYAYYQGCSDGGREGMVELDRYPADFDGIIAGDPYFDIGGEIVNSLAGIQVQLRSAGAALSPALLSQVDKIVMAKCDAADGVTDGLIQNPAQCSFDPAKDLPKCGAAGGGQCFSQDQINSLSAMLSAVTDPDGKIVYPGYSVSNLNDAGPYVDNLEYWLGMPTPPDGLLGPDPWSRNPAGQPQSWYWSSQTIRYLIYADEPGFDALKTPGIEFKASGGGPIGGFHAIIPKATLARLQSRSAAGDGDDPAAAAAFLRQGRKLIMYSGFADGDITPYRTTLYYRALAKLQGGYGNLQANARLFMVPGMAHCGGGPGPNFFGQSFAPPPRAGASDGPENDVIAALESWVEKGRAPQSIVATKYADDNPTHPVQRTMPLCPFPAMARYKGSGDVKDAGNWACPADDKGLLEIGPAGHEAGADSDPH